MDNLRYVIYSEDSEVIKVFKSPMNKIIRYGVVCIIFILALFYFLLGIDLYKDLSGLPKLILGLIIVYSIFSGKEKKEIKTPFEIRLYEDRMVLYQENRIFSSKSSAKCVSEILYGNLKAIKYEKETQILYIYGDMDATYYYYKPDGSLPDKPTQHKLAKDALMTFSIDDNDVDRIINDLRQYGNIIVLDKKTDRSLV